MPDLLRGIMVRLLLLCLGAGFIPSLWGETRWYISNAAGMVLENSFRALALRNKFALSVETLGEEDVPGLLRAYYTPGYQVEFHVLYEKGEISRRQWLFKDGQNRIRVVAAFNAAAPLAEIPAEEVHEEAEAEIVPEAEEKEKEIAGAAEETATEEVATEETEEEEPNHSGLIEIYDDQGMLAEDHQIDPDGTDRFIRYQYRNTFLIRAETRIKRPRDDEGIEKIEDYCADFYRYSRSNSLRAVERVFHMPEEEGVPPVRLRFPHVIIGIGNNKDFVSPTSIYSVELFQDIPMETGYRIVYTTDDRGRVLTETRKDDEGNVLGVLQNNWSGNRINSIHWKAGEDERLTEYEYDAEGDRILERNYNQGVLERVVRREGEQEVEELYMDGVLMLRTIWENGRKVSEERVRSGGGKSTGTGTAVDVPPEELK